MKTLCPLCENEFAELMKGEVGTEMYIVKMGEVEVVGGPNNSIVFVTLKEGSVFGEISLLALAGGNRRTADVRCRGYAQLFLLSKADFEEAMRDYPDAHKLLKRRAMKVLNKNVKPKEPESDVIEVITNKPGTPKLLKTVIKVITNEPNVADYVHLQRMNSDRGATRNKPTLQLLQDDENQTTVCQAMIESMGINKDESNQSIATESNQQFENTNTDRTRQYGDHMNIITDNLESNNMDVFLDDDQLKAEELVIEETSFYADDTKNRNKIHGIPFIDDGNDIDITKRVARVRRDSTSSGIASILASPTQQSTGSGDATETTMLEVNIQTDAQQAPMSSKSTGENRKQLSNGKSAVAHSAKSKAVQFSWSTTKKSSSAEVPTTKNNVAVNPVNAFDDEQEDAEKNEVQGKNSPVMPLVAVKAKRKSTPVHNNRVFPG